MAVLVWCDKRNVNVITTSHDSSLMPVPGKSDKITGQPLQKPTAIQDYNQYMGVVDKSDQMVLLNSTLRKTLKWTKKLFFHLLDLSVTNSFILYQIQGGRWTHFKFAKSLCQELISAATEDTEYVKPKRAGRVSSATNVRPECRDSTHWPVKNLSMQSGKNSMRACVVCKSQTPSAGRRLTKGESRKRKQSRYMCEGCEDHPALCITPCFKVYHTQKNYYA